MERSRLPVPRAPDLSLPSAKKPCPPKPAAPLYSRDPNIAFSAAAPACVVFKAGGSGKKPVPSKKPGPVRGPVNRYRAESELKDKIQLMEAANASLTSDLTSAQSAVQQMAEQQRALTEQLTDVQRRLEKCMMILECRNIDPVSGDLIIAAAEETSRVRAENKVFTGNLLQELGVFTLGLKDQEELLQTMRARVAEAGERRDRFLHEHEAFHSDLQQFQFSIEQAEKWLAL